jgi:penicillin-binding protein 2
MYQASCGIPQEGIKGLGDDPEESAVILAYYARAFGLGPPTGIDIGGEFAGTIPTPEWRKRHYSGPEFNETDRNWYYANTCFMGIGQDSVTASPLQIARMTAAVANGGHLVTPHVMKEVISPTGDVVQTAKTESQTVPVDAKNLEVIREGMRQCVTQGACSKAAVDDWAVAGKTGTAEFYKGDTLLQHAWFTGFAPFDDPEVVVTVYYETGWGGDKAAPAAAAILDYFKDNVQR